MPAREICDGIALRDLNLLEISDRLVEIDQPASGENAFRRDMSHAGSESPDDRLLAVRSGGQGAMPALGTDHERAGCAAGEACDTEPRARPDNDRRRAWQRGATADRQQIGRAEIRQRPGERFQVVDHLHPWEPQCLFQLRTIDHPGAVGEGATPILYRAGSGQDGAAEWSYPMPREIAFCRIGKGRMIRDKYIFDHTQLAAGPEGETRMRAADISKEDGSGSVGHRSLIRRHKHCPVSTRARGPMRSHWRNC